MIYNKKIQKNNAIFLYLWYYDQGENMAAINNQENKNIKDENQVKEYSFARYISDLRQKRNLTQKALAEKIQVSDRTISKWENGFTVPDLHNIRNICKELGVSANSVVLEKNTISDYFHNFIRFLIKYPLPIVISLLSQFKI